MRIRASWFSAERQVCQVVQQQSIGLLLFHAANRSRTCLFRVRSARLCRSIQSYEINSQILCFEKASLFFFCFYSFPLQRQVDVNNLCVLTPMAASGVGQLHSDLASLSNPRFARLPGLQTCVPFLCETVLQLLKPVRPQSIGLIRRQKGEKKKKSAAFSSSVEARACFRL